MAEGKEPGGWELLRAVEKIDKRMDDFAKGFVSVEVHRLLAEDVTEVRQSAERERAETKGEIERVRDDFTKALATMQTALDNAKKTRAQTWSAIGLLFVGGAVTLFYTVFARGLGLS